ncbi:hypothetical protein HWI79_2833 [Cryptosporidium felis]|nr:hypothetical protein HWI79_2833 [Cryptosporidium felis]
MMQTVMGNDSERSDQMDFVDLFVRRGVGQLPAYPISMMLFVRLSLKEKKEIFESGLGFGEKFGSLMRSLTLEPRPVFVEGNDSNKAFGGRFGAGGFGSRGGRNNHRGRVSGAGNQIGGGGGRRNMIRQPDENLWDMPCSEMNSLTLGDIREVESRMKAEDLTIDQYVEKQRESGDKRGSSFSQTNQKKNFVSIPIPGEVQIKVNNTFSLNCNAGVSSKSQPLGHGGANSQSHQQISSDHFLQRFGRKGALQNQHNSNEQRTQKLRESSISSSFGVGPPRESNSNSSSALPAVASKRTSSISEEFLKGPANLSLFDVSTPIFDDDNNESVIEFRPPIINKFDANLDGGNRSSGQNSRESHFGKSSQNSVSNFSWSSRGSGQDNIDNRGGNNIFSNISTSFPALSKNSQFSQSQVRPQNGHIFSSEPNILQKLQAAGISPKRDDNFRVGNLDNYKFAQSDYSDSFSKQFNPTTSEYPPLSSASNTGPSLSLSSMNHSHFKSNNPVKTNDAGRFLMSIIGAGQQSGNNSLSNRNFGSNFDHHSDGHFINQSGYINHNGNSSHNGSGNGYNHVGNFARY